MPIRPPASVSPPPAAAGYSGTPLPRKLGIKEGTRVRLVGASRDFATTLGPLPDGASLRRRGEGPRDVTIRVRPTSPRAGGRHRGDGRADRIGQAVDGLGEEVVPPGDRCLGARNPRRGARARSGRLQDLRRRPGLVWSVLRAPEMRRGAATRSWGSPTRRACASRGGAGPAGSRPG